ncbi:MAG: FAD-binding oxidoreductase [Parvularculaceae bacterium]|nr:FAD-binding oxidoreductase [Parvularculaceae bacterium]
MAPRQKSWGGIDRRAAGIVEPAYLDAAEAAAAGEGPTLGVGLGRSYGDSGLLSDGRLVRTTRMDRVRRFDREAGVFAAEAGITLGDVIRIVGPHGWFPPAVPGTQFVTLGGAIANDVHGKNHGRVGTLGAHVRKIALARSSGDVLVLAPGDPLFAATIGGLGLTGLILWAELQLSRVSSGYVLSETEPFEGLPAFFALSEDACKDEFSVAWVDCLSAEIRGLFTRANWAPNAGFPDRPSRPRLSFPIAPPKTPLNRATLAAFNALYYHALSGRRRPDLLPYDTALFPLDGVGGWNRLYGARGFFQYQAVAPAETASDAIAAMLAAIRDAGEGSFLAVLKTFGDRPSPGILSFPMKGATLALDFPNRGASTEKLFQRLDAIVREARGRLYPAKDARMPAALFREGYPRWAEMAAHVDPKFTSDFWKRMTDL